VQIFLIAIVSYLVWRIILKRKAGTGLLCFSILFFLIATFISVNMLKSVYEINVDKIKILNKEMISTLENHLSGKEIKQKEYSHGAYGKYASLASWLNEGLRIS
jgi:hypothetical protein